VQRDQEIVLLMEQMRKRLDSQLKAKLISLLGAAACGTFLVDVVANRTALNEELSIAESVFNDVNKRLLSLGMASIVRESGNFVDMVSNARHRPTPLTPKGLASADSSASKRPHAVQLRV
jgi:hypothetical protein